MSLHYRQGIFVTHNKNRLSSEQVRSSQKQDTLLGLGEAGWSKSPATQLHPAAEAALQGPCANRSTPGAGIRWGERQETSKSYQNIRYHVCYH